MDTIEKIHKGIEHVEQRLIQKVRSASSRDEIRLCDLSSELEWLITWSIKLEDLENRMWCDGVTDLQLFLLDKHSLNLKGNAFIGPEIDTNILYKCSLEGQISFSKTYEIITSYSFTVNLNGKIYKIQKTA